MAYDTYSSRTFKQIAGWSDLPDKEKQVQAPSYVICTEAGTYAFAYPDGTIKSGVTDYISGSVVVAGDGPVKLDINPVKWTSNSPGVTKGSVIFVYRRMG